MIGAVVLAAGRSTRMGRPKMILPWGETTVIGQVVSTLLEAHVAEVVVVTGGARQEVERSLKGFSVQIVFNPDYANGEMTRTLQVGLAALDERIRALLVVLGDQPQIETAVVRRVMIPFETQSHALVVPSYRRRRGHPWLAERSLWPGLRALQPPTTLRDFLDEHTDQIHYVDVDAPTILQDLDTPDDYQRFQPE